MTHYERTRSTGEPTTATDITEAAAGRPTLGFLLGLVFLIFMLSISAAGTDRTHGSLFLMAQKPGT